MNIFQISLLNWNTCVADRIRCPVFSECMKLLLGRAPTLPSWWGGSLIDNKINTNYIAWTNNYTETTTLSYETTTSKYNRNRKDLKLCRNKYNVQMRWRWQQCTVQVPCNEPVGCVTYDNHWVTDEHSKLCPAMIQWSCWTCDVWQSLSHRWTQQTMPSNENRKWNQQHLSNYS